MKIRVIFGYREHEFVFRSLYCDLDLESEKDINYYSARWKIEDGFK